MSKIQYFCAWHKKFYPGEGEKLMRISTTNDGKEDTIVSHGLCEACKMKMLAEVEDDIKGLVHEK